MLAPVTPKLEKQTWYDRTFTPAAIYFATAFSEERQELVSQTKNPEGEP